MLKFQRMHPGLFSLTLLSGAIAASQAACVASPADASTLAAAAAHQARARAEALLNAAVAHDVPGARGALCPLLAGRAVELLEPGQALAMEGFGITAVEPTWAGAEPTFTVSVDVTRNGAVVPRALRVRAREGCVDQLLDAVPVGSRGPDPGEISL